MRIRSENNAAYDTNPTEKEFDHELHARALAQIERYFHWRENSIEFKSSNAARFSKRKTVMKDKLEQIIARHEKFKSSYSWMPPGNAAVAREALAAHCNLGGEK